MSSREFSARRLDVKAFAEAGAELAQDSTLGAHVRLLQETQGRGADRPLRWSATGSLRNPGHVRPEVWLRLQAQATLPLVCQRCLQPVDVAVEVDNDFRFVADEATAAAEDDASEEDVLALSRSFDLLELLEDELLMALPLVPRHGECPEPPPMAAADPGALDDGPPPNPFAVLEQLRKRGK